MYNTSMRYPEYLIGHRRVLNDGFILVVLEEYNRVEGEYFIYPNFDILYNGYFFEYDSVELERVSYEMVQQGENRRGCVCKA